MAIQWLYIPVSPTDLFGMESSGGRAASANGQTKAGEATPSALGLEDRPNIG